MNTTLVTGGAGFIGSHVIDALLAKNEKVVCIDNLSRSCGQQNQLRNIGTNINNANFTFIKTDINDFEDLKKIFNNYKFDRIVHLAAKTGVRPSIENPVDYGMTNIIGTVNLLELSKKYNIEKFVFASSSSVYGNEKKIPFSEDVSIVKPISPYAATKMSCELFCYNYSCLSDMDIICLRFFTVYGPRGRPDMAPYLFTDLIQKEKSIKMFGDGSTKRDYTYISDIASGILSALDKNLKFEIINLGNSKTIELNYFISLIEELLEKKAKIERLPEQLGDVKITCANISKARKMLNYNPKVSIEDGMKLFINWYKSVM